MGKGVAAKPGSLSLIPGVLVIEAENRIPIRCSKSSPSVKVGGRARTGLRGGGGGNLTWKCRAFMGNEDPAGAAGRAVGGLASEMVLQSMPLGIYFGKIKQATSLAFKTQKKNISHF